MNKVFSYGILIVLVGHSAAVASAEDRCLPDPSLFSDLKKRQALVESKEKDLAQRVSDVEAREKAVADEIKRLDQLKGELQAVQQVVDKQREERLTKLVETVEGMSPKAAAQLISKVEDELAVQSIAKLSTQKLSKILAQMEPARASRLSELLTGYSKRKKQEASDDRKPTDSRITDRGIASKP